VPSVTFLGTRFENLRIGGREVQPIFDLNIVGSKPAGDKPYVQDAGFLSRVSKQYERISEAPGLSDSARAQYHWDLAKVQQQGKVECSLVTSVPQALPGRSYGHVVELAGIGTVSLAKLTVGKAFNLTIVSLDAGSSGGTIDGGQTAANGGTHPRPPAK